MYLVSLDACSNITRWMSTGKKCGEWAVRDKKEKSELDRGKDELEKF